MDHSSDDSVIGNNIISLSSSSSESTNGNETSSLDFSLSPLSGSSSVERHESPTRTSERHDHGTNIGSMGDDQMSIYYPNFVCYPEFLCYPSNTPYPLININNPNAPFPGKDIESREEKVINLREWLETEGASKAYLVGLFRKIVTLVDGLHQQGMGLLDLRPSMFGLKGDGLKYLGRVTRINARKRGLGEGTSGENNINISADQQKKSKVSDHMEKEWYAFPEEFENSDLAYCNVFCLGLLLFEFLSHFERIEEYNEAMMCLHHRKLPPDFFSGTHKEAQSCSWLLLPEPSSYPTTREILESKWLCELESRISSTDEDSSNATANEAETDLLLNFLVLSNQHNESEELKLLEQIKLLDFDIEFAKNASAVGEYLGTENKDIPESSTSRKNVLWGKLQENLSQLETAYFSLGSNATVTGRTDADVLKCRESWSFTQAQPDPPKPANRVEALCDGIGKLARGNKFELCGMLKNIDMLNPSYKAICSLCVDRDEEYFAAAGMAKKIKIFEIRSFLDDDVDVQYPVVEMTNESILSCISWNTYITCHLVSADYEGSVTLWDTRTGQRLALYMEHQKKTCSVDISSVHPGKFASGGDDCSVRIWTTNERKSVGVIRNRASVCCVQFSAYSSHILAYGSSDNKTYVYDLRHTRNPWCTLGGHEGSVSYVRFVDSDTMVSASLDSTLKLWDLNKTSLQGLSTDACGLTFRGHTNRKNFVGMAVMDGYIATGSETNEVYAYYKSLPTPVATHKLECIYPAYGSDEKIDSAEHFISSVCWRKKSQMVIAGNSHGNINILRMV